MLESCLREFTLDWLLSSLCNSSFSAQKTKPLKIYLSSSQGAILKLNVYAEEIFSHVLPYWEVICRTLSP